ncbi:MAG: TonB family protein [Thermoanaerobaculales bacterium]|nr:TonB family protein [Thermoanaerobaculales bacterium]
MPKSKISKFGVWLLAFSLVSLTSFLVGAQQVPFFVIVHPDNDAEMLSRQTVSDIFLKKTTKWADNLPAEPVDLSSDSAIREAFSIEVHNRSTANIKSHWQKQIFSGAQSPPLEVAAEEEAVAFVRQHRGAIAYVSTSASFDDVKIIPLVNPPVVIKKVAPSYSQRALRFRVEGDVVLRLQITEEGKVEHVTVLKGLKYGLTEEAVRAVKKWRFEPATSSGMAVSADIDVTVNFCL